MIASIRGFIAAAAGLLALHGPSHAQSYPDRPVHIVVPYAAGGITDIIGRLLAQGLGERWKQTVIVDNRPGANGQIGADAVVRADPDGYTLLVSADATFVMNQHLYKNARFDPLTDLAPITGLGFSPQALVLNPKSGIKSVTELIDYGKAHPGELAYGTFGAGSSGHLNPEILSMMTGAHFTPVHYQGAGPAIIDLVGGHIQFMIVSVGLVSDLARDGQLRIIAIGSDKRLEQLPDTPTLLENSFTGFEKGSWYGLAAPKATPPEIIAKINRDATAIFDDPEFQKKSLAPSYIFSIATNPADFMTMMRRESAKWEKVIETTHISLQ